MKTSFIVPAHNSALTLRKTLESILTQTIQAHEIIVVVNGSQDDSETIASSMESVKVITLTKANRAGARNAGSQLATGDLLAFVDSDVVLDPQWLENALACLEENPFTDIIATKVVPDLGTHSSFLNNYRNIYRKWVSNETYLSLIKPFFESYTTVPVVNTAACLYRSYLFKHVDGFDENFKREEDAELSRRAYHCGASIYGLENSVAYVGTGSYKDSILRYLKRFWELGESSLLFHQKWAIEKSRVSFYQANRFSKYSGSYLHGSFMILTFALHSLALKFYSLRKPISIPETKLKQTYAIMKSDNISDHEKTISHQFRCIQTADRADVQILPRAKKIVFQNEKLLTLKKLLSHKELSSLEISELRDAGILS